MDRGFSFRTTNVSAEGVPRLGMGTSGAGRYVQSGVLVQKERFGIFFFSREREKKWVSLGL